MTGRAGLFKIELPDHTAYLTDGGFFPWGGNTYDSYDSVLGSIASLELMTEGKTGEIPAIDLAFNVPSSTAITVFSEGSLQKSTVSIWLAQYDPQTHEILGTPDLQFLGQIDQPSITIGAKEFSVSLSIVSKFEWIFEGDTGNSLSASFHKDMFAGETGHDNATGLSIGVAWGTETPRSGTTNGPTGRQVAGWDTQAR